MQTNTTIKEIIKQRLKGKSIYRLALELGVAPIYLYDVIAGRRVSRRLIYRVAEHLHIPDLLYLYEKQLRSKSVGRQGEKSTPNKGGRTHV